MWPVTLIEDPLDLKGRQDAQGKLLFSSVVLCQVPLAEILQKGQEEQRWQAFQQGERVAKVALADFYARVLASSAKDLFDKQNEWLVCLEPLEWTTSSTSRTRRRKRANIPAPFIMERTDVYCQDEELYVYLRLLAYADQSAMTETADDAPPSLDTLQTATRNALARVLLDTSYGHLLADAMNHIATAVLQERLRSQLESNNMVAFVANAAILPRKSGASAAPMASPPAVPFVAPLNSVMETTMQVEMGLLKTFLRTGLTLEREWNSKNGCSTESNNYNTCILLTGMMIPRGVTLIVGGGYHGKSTMLRCIAAGIYNKCPGDGREFCVTVHDAVTVRAEDGRYVNNCNVSAFISNLPTPPGVSKALDTRHFSTGEASGSTSQAANVVEAIEMGASAFLVDEDVSAANFMARDGRMRAMVMDESITPLLYRVNGLYNSRGISSIVVVGGVGDWLDVPHQVILMDKYSCFDATAKANSVSKQFSHGHVQYGGRGVVHRLEWEKSGTPIPRRPTDASCGHFDRKHTAISLMEGSDAILVHPLEEEDESLSAEVEEDKYIDMSRCEQLMCKKPQLYGTGLCTLWVMEACRKYPNLGLADLLQKLDGTLEEKGLMNVISNGPMDDDSNRPAHTTAHWKLLVETLGCAYRPRRFEVGQALTRLHGIEMEEVPVDEDHDEIAAQAEAARKKQELLDMWKKRRQNKLTEGVD